MTLQLLWVEHTQRHSDGYQYTQFVHRYRQWARGVDLVLRQDHRAGQKAFIDFVGQTVPITDLLTGVVSAAQLFVAVLGGGSLTYAEVLSPRNRRTGLPRTPAPLSSSAARRRSSSTIMWRGT